jgi:hypothetical protein
MFAVTSVDALFVAFQSADEEGKSKVEKKKGERERRKAS